MEDPFLNSKQESTFGEETSSDEDSRYNSSVPGSETEMVENSLDERSSPLEKANMSILLNLLPLFLRFFLHFSLSFSFFHLSLPYIFHFSRLH